MKKISLVVTLLLSGVLFAQNYKPGKVSEKELKETQYQGDPSVAASILNKEGKIYFDFNSQGKWVIVTDVLVRLKVYTKEGYNYANVEIPYYDYAADWEDVKFSDAAVYNIVDGEIQKTKVEDDGLFTEQTNKKWRTKKITFPNVKEGSVIEYRYIKKSPYLSSLPDWYFQYSIPVKHIEVEFAVPHYFIYNRVKSPYIELKEGKETRQVVRQYSHVAKKGPYGVSSSTLRSESGQVGFYENVYTYEAENVPALKTEAFIDNINNYKSFIKHELASVQYPDSEEKKYAYDWDSVAALIYNEESFGEEIDKSDYYQKDLNSILEGKINREEITTLVFEYVKNRMAWDGEYGYTCKKGVKKAYESRSGNVADINLMLISMLRYAGLKANPILLSTRDKGHVAFVNRDEFNYVITGVEIQNKTILLDATSKYATQNILPVRDLNLFGRMIKENLTSKEISLLPEQKSRKNVVIIGEVNTDGTVMGKCKIQNYDYNALALREMYNGINDEAKIQRYENSLAVELSNYELNDLNDAAKPVSESFDFKTSTDVAGNKIYISPLLSFSMTQNPFNETERKLPIDFIYPQNERYIITFTIPEGYVVESIPESVLYATQDDYVSFKFTATVNQNNQLQIIAQEDLSFARFNPEYYTTLKDIYGDIVKKQSEKIVLVKK
ncbi:DUF3857 domain-containing protein [Flavobacterium alkalisoli]|uniref:DUF3857 domain-containing protein n=1 Tax=Flavobacterium alkalisoli TaxID=2602769 RepID=UPI003A8F6C82